jgi:hypothetical protein
MIGCIKRWTCLVWWDQPINLFILYSIVVVNIIMSAYSYLYVCESWIECMCGVILVASIVLKSMNLTSVRLKTSLLLISLFH